MVDLLQALIDEKWLLAAAAVLWGYMQYRERIVDKQIAAKERKEMRDRLEKFAAVLYALKDRLK